MRFLELLAVSILAAGLVSSAEARAHALAKQAFSQAEQLEWSGRFLASAERFETAAATGHVDGYWRAARSVWRHSETLATDASAERVALLQRVDALASRGLEADPGCGECSLWKYAALGRLTEHHGWLWASRHAREMKQLLDHGIRMQPDHRDPNGNATMANLLYASATFHRMVPEWWWLRLVVGVRGDTERALADIEGALTYSADRIDYRVEYGAVLLCNGQRHGRGDRIAEGRVALRRALSLPRNAPSDEIDQGYAAQLLEHPSEACGWSRRGFMDVEGDGRNLAQQLAH